MHSTSRSIRHTARIATSRPYPTVKLNLIWKLQMSARLKYETIPMLCVGSYLLLSFLLVFRFTVLHFTWVPFLIKYRLFYFFSILPLYMSISFIYTPSSRHYIVFPESWTGKARYRHLCLRHSRLMFHFILTPLHQLADTMLSFFNLSLAILPIQFANRSSIKVL